jgi:glycosyltransferase involved in cell wall biosynthesis
VRGALKVDFWDVYDTADKILAVLNNPTLADELRRHADAEVRRLTWDKAARRCIHVYAQLLAERSGLEVSPLPEPGSAEGVRTII